MGRFVVLCSWRPPARIAGKFLEMVRQQLSQDFSEMRSASSENLLYIKEDLIIPHVSPALFFEKTLKTFMQGVGRGKIVWRSVA